MRSAIWTPSANIAAERPSGGAGDRSRQALAELTELLATKLPSGRSDDLKRNPPRAAQQSDRDRLQCRASCPPGERWPSAAYTSASRLRGTGTITIGSSTRSGVLPAGLAAENWLTWCLSLAWDDGTSTSVLIVFAASARCTGGRSNAVWGLTADRRRQRNQHTDAFATLADAAPTGRIGQTMGAWSRPRAGRRRRINPCSGRSARQVSPRRFSRSLAPSPSVRSQPGDAPTTHRPGEDHAEHRHVTAASAQARVAPNFTAPDATTRDLRTALRATSQREAAVSAEPRSAFPGVSGCEQKAWLP